MKVYKGTLKKETLALIEQSKNKLNRLIAVGLGKPASLTYTIEESIAKHNTGISKEEIQAWVWYRRKSGVPMENWKSYHVDMTPERLFYFIAKGILFVDPITASYVPFPVFVFGNLYKKIDKLVKMADTIINNFSESIYEQHLRTLEENKPNPLSIQNPIESERPVILLISQYTRVFKVKSLRSETGVFLSDSMSLREAFSDWLTS